MRIDRTAETQAGLHRPQGWRAWSRTLITCVLVVVAALTVLGSLVTTVVTSTGRMLVTFGDADPRLPLSSLPQLLQADLREGASGTLADLDLGMRLLGAAPSLVHAVTVGLAAWSLVRVLRGVSAAAPFSPRVLKSWTYLTLVLLVGGVVEALADTAAVLYLSTRFGLLWSGDGLTPEEKIAFLGGDYMGIGIDVPTWPVPILVAGLVALALTTAFRAGARLERDVDGVV